MNIKILEKIEDELKLHVAFLKILENNQDDCYTEEFQILLDYFADRLMRLDDLLEELNDD